MIKREKKICFSASSGGHLEQLMMLEPLMQKYDSFIVTEKTKYSPEIKDKKVFYLSQINRKERLFFFKILKNVFISVKIYINEKPDLVISTGVLSTIPMCIIAKIFGKKLIYIESFAKITSPTRTGKLMYKISDQFYVQWESMLEFYPNAIFLGGIY